MAAARSKQQLFPATKHVSLPDQLIFGSLAFSRLERASRVVSHSAGGAASRRGSALLRAPRQDALRELLCRYLVFAGEAATPFLQRVRLFPHLPRSRRRIRQSQA